MRRFGAYAAGLGAALCLSASTAFAQATFAVDDILTNSGLEDKVTEAATAIGAVIGTIVLVWLAFRLVQVGMRYARKAV